MIYRILVLMIMLVGFEPEVGDDLTTLRPEVKPSAALWHSFHLPISVIVDASSKLGRHPHAQIGDGSIERSRWRLLREWRKPG